MENKNPIQVADRLFQALELLAENGTLGLKDISLALALNKSTTHRILNSLIYMGYVKQDSENSKYFLSLKIWEVANKSLSHVNVINTLKPYLSELVSLSGETVHLVQLDHTDAIYIDKVEAYQNPLRLVSRVGKRIPLYCSGVGKAMLAQMPDTSISEIWKHSEITAFTPKTITGFDVFLREMESVRHLGYALDDEENEQGVKCIAVAFTLFDVSYAISISAHASKMNPSRIAELADYLFRTKRQMTGV